MVEDEMINAHRYHPGITIDKCIIMLNHIHEIICIGSDREGTPRRAFPTESIPEYINRFKTMTTKRYIDGVNNQILKPFEHHIWQKSYYDRIIRNESEYDLIWDYIDTNPLMWQQDRYFMID